MHVLPLLMVASLACSEPPSDNPPAPPPLTRPDIVLVVVDTMRADRLSAEGHHRPTTPHLDALAARGMRYARAYAHSSWTLPSMVSLLTGLLPHEHRVGSSRLAPGHMGALPERRHTLPEVLAGSGYRSAAFVNNPFLSERYKVHQGFDPYDHATASNQYHRTAQVTVDTGLAWLGSATDDDRPALLMLHIMEPHLDYAPPDSTKGTWSAAAWPASVNPETPHEHVYIELQQKKRKPDPDLARHVVDLYDEEVLATDLALGSLVSALDARDGLADTVIAVTADHGEEFWEHDSFEHGHSLLGEVTRVPLVVAGADVSQGVSHTPVGHVDLFQTLVAAGGARPVNGTQGESLLSLDHHADRTVLSENLLYGPPAVSAVDRHTRVVVDLQNKQRSAWAVADDGSELEEPSGLRAQGRIDTVYTALIEARGGLDDWAPEETAPSEAELEALGYVE